LEAGPQKGLTVAKKPHPETALSEKEALSYRSEKGSLLEKKPPL
jgi:hypothetical protein